MAIDGCSHTFARLAEDVLPAHMSDMRIRLTDPWPMADFAGPGIGVKALLKKFGLAQDFSGCYVLLEEGVPVYVGISRGVVGRLRQHVFGKSHLDASLAFKIAMTRHPGQTLEKLTRSQAMSDPLFGTSFAEAQSYLRSLYVAAIHIENPIELYVFEPYCALELDTHQWNSFRTH